MSFSQLIYKSIDDTVNKFFKELVAKYNINEKDLVSIWNTELISPQAMDVLNTQMGSTSISDAINNPKSYDKDAIHMPSSAELSKLSIKELKNHCKLRGLKLSGTKPELLERLNGGETSLAVKQPIGGKKRKLDAEPETPSIIKSIQTTIQCVKLEKNKFGNFEHSETHLVFDRVTQHVIGKQDESGAIHGITVEDIELCNKFKFKYVLPDNLNLNKKSNNVVVEGLADELGEDFEEEVAEDQEELDEDDENEEPEEFVEDEEDFVEDD